MHTLESIVPIRMGISACLLGQPVRYDGQHKHDHYLTEVLGPFFDYVPVCPEVECGLPVPREAMRLVGSPDAPRLLGQRSSTDHTERMNRWAETRIEALRDESLGGFIFKSKSPSSGLFRVKLYGSNGNLAGSTSGLFARKFVEAFPRLPVEEEGRLHDVLLRENFIERVFTLQRFRAEVLADPTVRALIDFHARNKFLLMAHQPDGLRTLGQRVAGARAATLDETLDAYEETLMRVMAEPATPQRHVNVLQHMQGYFSERLSADERAEMVETIDGFRTGLTPLIVPLVLLRHYVRKYSVAYLAGQYYLEPHPAELKLRNHA